ncbi:MAG: hypothetical protein AB8B87_25895 [Granulosicoccus sp.]
MKIVSSVTQRLRYRTAAVLAVSFAFPVSGHAFDVFNASQTICINETTQEQRNIELVYQTSDSPIPCTLYYDKAGKREEVASAKNTKGHCEKIERKMVRNLLGSGWNCQHSFLGEIGLQEKSEISLNLFSTKTQLSSGDNAIALPGDDAPLAGNKDGIDSNTVGEDTKPALTLAESPNDLPAQNNESAESIANRLKATLEEEYIGDLQDRIQEDFSDALGSEYVVDVTVRLNLDVSISQTPVTEDSEPEITLATDVDDSSSETMALNTRSISTDTENSTPLVASLPASQGSYTLASQAFGNEQDAHRFAAEFHGMYPGVYSRVGQFNDEQTWRLVLGMDDQQERLSDGISQLDTRTQGYFEVLKTPARSTHESSLVLIPDDWARYAVASCYAKGKTTSQELAECADVVLDVDSFLSCLAGGICNPERLSEDLTPTQIDFLEVVGSDDPVAAARSILITDFQGCENLTNPGSEEAAECVALSILDDDQRQMYECYQNADENLDLIDCVGNETLSDNLILYERCSIDSITMTECVMAEVNNEHLNAAARCVNYDETEAILSCAIESNIDTDQSRVLACVTGSSTRADQAQCLSREYLDTEQAALLDCARGDVSEADFGLCVANQRGMLSGDEYRAAECLLAGETEPNSLLNCAGARFASNELNQCLDASIPLSDCFTTETLISEVVASNIDNLIDVQAIDNEIAMFRADLYALEGGDLTEVLSDEASAELFSTTEEIVEKVKKKGGGLLKKLGF